MISTKFKHGDIVVCDHDKILQFGKVQRLSKVLLPRDKNRYRDCLHQANINLGDESEIVVCLWYHTRTMDYIVRRFLRLATRAEIILYGKK